MNAPRVAVIVALREELAAVRTVIFHARRSAWGVAEGFTGTIRGVPVAAARTGIGAARAEAGARALLVAARPGFVVATGFAGGLYPGLVCGDLLVADEVLQVSGDPESPAVTSRWRPLPAALAAARALPPPPRIAVGRLATVTRAIRTAAEKRALGEALGADAADMESAAVARVAAELGAPLLCARAVVDDAAYDLPLDFERVLDASGRPRLLRLAAALISRPSALIRVVSLAARARKAAESLAAFLPPLVEALR